MVIENKTASVRDANPNERVFDSLCPLALKLGFDSIQYAPLLGTDQAWKGFELVICSGKCATDPFVAICPTWLGLRTGARHDRPCECDDEQSALNCGNAPTP